jgi:hypothetical protein
MDAFRIAARHGQLKIVKYMLENHVASLLDVDDKSVLAQRLIGCRSCSFLTACSHRMSFTLPASLGRKNW